MVGRRGLTSPKTKYWCVVPGCTSDVRKHNNLTKYPWMENVIFEPFPTKKREPRLRAKWIAMIRRPADYEPLVHHRVCSRHFVGNCRSENNPIPELFPWNNYKQPTKPSRAVSKREACTSTTSHSNASNGTSIVCSSDEDDDGNDVNDQRTTVDVPIPSFIPVQGQKIQIWVAKHVDVETPTDTTNSFTDSNITEDLHAEHSYSRHSLCYSESKAGCNYDPQDKQCQTDLTSDRIGELEAKLNDKDALLRDLFIEKVTNSDTSIKNYTGLPNKAFFDEISNIAMKFEPNLKYWTGEKSKEKKNYQETGNKPGPQRKLSKYQ